MGWRIGRILTVELNGLDGKVVTTGRVIRIDGEYYQLQLKGLWAAPWFHRDRLSVGAR